MYLIMSNIIGTFVPIIYLLMLFIQQLYISLSIDEIFLEWNIGVQIGSDSGRFEYE